MKKGCFSKVSHICFVIVVIFSTLLFLQFQGYMDEHAFAGTYWIQTTQGDFTAGTLENVTVTLEGNVTLSFSVQDVEDDFFDESKIALKDNMIVDTFLGQARLKTQPNEINQTYGGSDVDLGWDVRPTPDGGYIIGGASVSYGPGFYDAWQIKTDSMGFMEWDKTFGGTEKDGARSIALTNDGGYILGGYADSYGNPGHDFWLLKTDSSGNEEWNHTYGGMGSDASWKPFSTHQTTDSGYIICGYETSFGSDGSYDAWVVKTDSMGMELWSNTFGGLGSEYGNGIQETADGGFILVGHTTSFGNGGTDLWLVKLNSMGTEEWNKTYGGVPDDWGGSVYQTEDGGFIITGDTKTYTSGGFDFWLIKTDSDGNEQWNTTFGRFNADDTGHSVKPTSDGGYIILGVTTVFSSDTDIWLVKTDDMGNEEWNRYFGGPGDDWAFSVNETSDGAYVIVGDTSSYGSGSNDVWLLKYAPPVRPYGELYSTNLLAGKTVSFIESFIADTTIPANTMIELQFSQDNVNWYNSMGIPGVWDPLMHGLNTMDLTALGWSGSNFYYRMNFSTQIGATPILYYVNVSYSGYASSGLLTSQAYDCGGSNVRWKQLNWTEYQPSGCDIGFQLRSADTQANLSSSNFTGPDGNTTTYYTVFSGQVIWSGHDGERWIQYKAFLTGTGVETSILEDVFIYYNFIPDIPVLIAPSHDIWISDSTPFFNWTFLDSDGTQQGFQVIIDSDPAFGSIDYDSGMQAQVDSNWQFPWGTGYTDLMDGIWFWKVRVQDDDGDWSNYTMERIIKIDTTPPVSTIASPVNNSYINSSFGLSGTASDGMGAGLFKIEVCILRVSDGQVWNGTNWVALESWLSVSGLSPWSKSTGLPVWETNTIYNIRSRGTDNISNVEIPGEGSTFVFDTDSPQSYVDIPFEGSYLKDLSLISGTSLDYGGAYVDHMEISIKRNSDDQFWNGSSWVVSEFWLLASGSTSWSYNTSFPAWENGVNYTVRSRAFDSATNVEIPKSGNTFTIDSLAPSPPMQVTATPVGWTNSNSFDVNWINPTDVSGVLEGAYYKLDSPPAFETDGIWVGTRPIKNITVSGDGAHTIYVWLEDSVGNVDHLNYNTTILYFDSEITTPVSVIATPGTWTNSNSFLINWTDPSDLSGVFPGAYYKLDSPPISDTDGIWVGSKPITGIMVLGDGTHTIYVWLLDNAGNLNYQNNSSVTLFYEFTDPEAPLDLSATPNTWTNINSFSISWVNPDDMSGIAGAFYKFDSAPAHDSDGVYVPGNDIGSISNIAVPGEGEHILYLWLLDNAGNINRFNYNTTSLNFDSEVLAPTGVTPEPNYWTNINSFNISWINPPDSSGISGTYYKLDLPPTSNSDGVLVTGDDIELISDIAVAGDGEHTVYLWLVDDAQNANYTDYVTTTVFYDSLAPLKPDLDVTPASWSSDNSFSIDWTPPAESGTSGIKTGVWYKLGSSPESNDHGTWIGEKPYLISGISEGETPLYVWLEDFAGNRNYENYEIWTLKYDDSLPVVTFLSPEDGEWSNQSSYLVRWEGADSYSDIVKYEIKRNTGAYLDLGLVSEYLFESLIQGKHTISVRATDSAGNENESSVDLYIDKIIPTVTITSPDNNANFAIDVVEIKWAATDSGSGMHHYEIRLDEGDLTDVGLVKNHTLSGLSNGAHTVIIRGFDKALNWQEYTIRFNVSVYVVPDSDGDGLNDTVDPDDDNDGLPDTWEELYGLDRLNASDAAEDSDDDGLNNTQEFKVGTYPNDPDTDGDGHNDGKDAYPLDASKWKEESTAEDSPWGLIALIVVIAVAAILLVLFLNKKKPVESKDKEELIYEDLEEEEDVEIEDDASSDDDSLGVDVDTSEDEEDL